MADDDVRSSMSLTSSDEDQDTTTHQQPVEPGQVNENPRLRSSGNDLEATVAAQQRREDSLGAPELSARSDIHHQGVSELVEPSNHGEAGAPPSQTVHTEFARSTDLTASQPTANVPTNPFETEHEVAGTAQPPLIEGSVHNVGPGHDAAQSASNRHCGFDLGAEGLDLGLGGDFGDAKSGQTPEMRHNSDPMTTAFRSTHETTECTRLVQVQTDADVQPRSKYLGRRLLNRVSKPLLRGSRHRNATDLPPPSTDANRESVLVTDRGFSSATAPAAAFSGQSAWQDMAQAGSHQRAASEGGMPSGRGRAFSNVWASLSASLSRASGSSPTRETSVVQPQPTSGERQPRSRAVLRERKSTTAVTKDALKKSGRSSWNLVKKVAKEIGDLGDAYAAVVDQRVPAPRRGMNPHRPYHGPAQLNADYVSEADNDAADLIPEHDAGYDGLYDTSRSSSLPRGRPNTDTNNAADDDASAADNGNLEHSQTAPEPPTDASGAGAELGKKSLRQRWASTWRRNKKREQNVVPGN